MKELAIVIPGYNCGTSIKRCLDSIICQITASMEVIFVDDGSTDDTKEVVSSFEGRIRYIYQENGGVSSARNTGIEAAKEYSFIMFVDSDDWLEDGCIQYLLEYAYKADFVFCDWNEYKVKNHMPFVKENKINYNFNKMVTIDELRNHFLRSRSGGCPWGKIYKNDILSSYRIRFMEGLPYAEDYLFNLEYLRYATSVYYVQKALYAYNCTQEGARAIFRRNRVDITIQIEQKKWELYSLENEKYRILMDAELVEQMAVAVTNLRDKRFSKKERKIEWKKIAKLLKKRQLGISMIARTRAGFYDKLKCMYIIIIAKE